MILLLAAGCLDNTPIPGGDVGTFIALQSDFAGFSQWSATPVSSEDTGHVSGARTVYVNQAPPAGSTTFPVGTILVKTIEWEGGTDIHAMAKRGAGFNTDGANGWEWFELMYASDGTPVIRWRGDVPPTDEEYGQLPGAESDTSDTITGDCNVCHSTDAVNDYVHTIRLDAP